MPKTREIKDEQTGQVFPIIDEHWFDVLAAWFSAGYSLFVIWYLARVLIDTWSGQYYSSLIAPFRSVLLADVNPTGFKVDPDVFKLVVYTAVGGGMGAAINNIRGFVQWHAERQAFGWRFVWKYIALPPLGATLAVLVYGIIQSGMAVFSGGGAPNTTGISSFTAWATGTLAGYGSHKVFIWLDDKVNSLFKVDTKTVNVPDVRGKTLDEAKQILINAKLGVGETSEAEAADVAQVGKVIGQSPVSGSEIVCESKVALIIGIKPAGEGVEEGNGNIDATRKSQEEVEKILQNGNLTETVSEEEAASR